jgi:3-hydroxyisobutyrate dehydrogenase-like beta-hydroxyacid dehydrogenase
MTERAQEPAGVVGLGMMGGEAARHALAAGYQVYGYDVTDAAMARFAGAGGQRALSPADVARRCPVALTSLPSIRAFRDVIGGPEGIAASGAAGHVVVETSTLPLSEKEWGHELLARNGITLLDCTLSGTGGQMRSKDIVVYASGDAAAVKRCLPLLETFSRKVYELGDFGNGSRMKFIANHLVTIHNVAAAESLLLAKMAGLDLGTVLEAVTDGAGTSRMLEVRGPMMIRNDFSDATMRMDTYQKDIDTIAGFARALHCPLPLFAASAELYRAALGQGLAAQEVASVFTVLARLAGAEPRNPGGEPLPSDRGPLPSDGGPLPPGGDQANAG